MPAESPSCIARVHPAPLWRRFAAAGYDGLLLLALWMTAALLAGIAQDLLQVPPGSGWQQGLRVYFFLLGMALFGWFWTHGGQTPGLKAWRLRIERRDGRALRWPVAAVRYTAMLACWIVSLAPLLLLAPPLLATHPLLAPLAWACLALLAAATVWSRIDPSRRAPQDRVASTRVVLVRTAATATPSTAESAQPVEAPPAQKDEDEGRARRRQ